MALLPLIASVVLIGITSQYANGAGLDPDILRSRRQEDLKGCTMSSMDKCYSILPPDGTAPNTLVEEIGQVDGPQKCQAFCKDLYSNTCNWFMYDRTTKDCMLFSGSLNDLRADCNEIGYPREPSYDACDVVFSGDDGCYNFREDYCRFEFGLLDNLDDIETVAECQSACQYIQGCNYFMYDQPSKTCKLNTNVTTSRTCDIVHGTPEPNLQTCIDDGKLDWTSESDENGDSSQSVANPTTTPPTTTPPTTTPAAFVPRDSDECLASTPNWGPGSKCQDSESMCVDRSGSWAKDVRRCCPETCGTGVLTKAMCEALVSKGTCTYPNAAQGSGEPGEGQFALKKTDVRCSGPKLFEGFDEETGFNDCRLLCENTDQCKFYASWRATDHQPKKWCETYESCPSTRSDGGLPIDLWSKNEA